MEEHEQEEVEVEQKLEVGVEEEVEVASSPELISMRRIPIIELNYL